jgi:hypothetical protein
MHQAMAKGHGATEEDLAELAIIASYTSRWSAIVHAQNYNLDTFK